MTIVCLAVLQLKLEAIYQNCPKCRRQSLDLREITASTSDAEEARRRVLDDFSRVLDAQLDECDQWESSGYLHIIQSQLVN